MSKNILFLYLRAIRLIHKGDYSRAINVCREILDAGETSAGPFHWMSHSYKSMDDLDNAVSYAEKALWRNPNPLLPSVLMEFLLFCLSARGAIRNLNISEVPARLNLYRLLDPVRNLSSPVIKRIEKELFKSLLSQYLIMCSDRGK